MRQLPAVILTIVFVIAFLVMGGVVTDFLGNSVKTVLGSNYTNSTTEGVISSVKTLYSTVQGIVPLPIVIGLLGIAIASLVGFGFRGDRA